MVAPRRAKKTAEDFRREWGEVSRSALSGVSLDGVRIPDLPGYAQPKLPTRLAEISDRDLIDHMVRYARYTDFHGGQTAIEEINEALAEQVVRRLENLFMLRNRPEKPQSGDLSILKAQMEQDEEILEARKAHQVVYARRKLQKMLMESAERDGAVCSRELTRRTDMEKLQRRSDRSMP